MIKTPDTLTPETVSPRTGFDWTIYADATFAGLSALIPVPVVDWFFEVYYRTRMPVRIARYRGHELPREVIAALNSSGSCADTCLTLPFKAALELLKLISRKLLYFLAIAEAADKVNLYWHQAFLYDTMLLRGHLSTRESARAARQAMKTAIAASKTNPLSNLSRNVVGGTRHILRTLSRARRGTEDSEVQEKKTLIADRWDEYAGYLLSVAARYNEEYERQIRT